MWRRRTAVGAALVALLATTTTAHAAAISVHPSDVQASAGTVAVVRTADPAGGTATYAVTIRGQVGVHG